MFYKLLPLLLSLSIFIITYSCFHITVLKSKLHRHIKEYLNLIYFAVALFLFLGVYLTVKDIDFLHLQKSAIFMSLALIAITIFSLVYLIALYVQKIEKIFNHKLTKLRRNELILMNLALLFLSLILGIYFGFLMLLLIQL